MKHTILLAPAAFIVAGFAATPSHAHDVVTATVGIPAVTVGVGGVVVTVGQPAPPPRQVVVVEQPAPQRVVYVEDRPSVVYVHPRDERVVYVEDEDCHHPHGNAYGYWKKHGKHERDHERGHGHEERAVYIR